MTRGNGSSVLTQRLAEAEGIIEALLSGQVDAVVEPKTKSPLLLAKAQEALRLSKRHLRGIIDGLGPGIFVGLLTPEGILVEVNQSPLVAAGLKPEDVIGKPFDQTPWWSGSEEIRQQLRDAIARAARGEASRYDVRTKGEGDEIIDIDFSLQPMRDDTGEVVFLIPSASVITERKEMEAALREQASLLDNAREAIQVKDLGGRVIYWNKGAERLYGFTASEMMGRKTVGVICKDVASIETAHAILLATGEWQGEMIKRTKDGRDITVEVRWTLVLDAHGQPKSVLAIDADVTLKKTLESQLMVSDRMASVGTLAAGVAHEINNPLAALIANLDFIAESFAPGSGGSRMKSGMVGAGALDEIRGPLEDAREAAQRVRAIVRDLKIFSRSPSDEERGPVNVKTIMESSLGMAWNEIRHRARLVKVYGEVPDVEANEGRLGQVFLNLLVNAAQAMSEGRAEHNVIRVTTRLEGGRVITEVCDTGPGIAPEIIGRIFDAFFTTKAVGVGTGLGLAICQRIVTDMGGDLTVKSELGKGTTFFVTLPIAGADEREVKTPAPAAAVSARRGRILVIDDELMLVKIVTRILSKEHDVVGTLAAREGLAFCARGDRFDLILCDLMMPDMTGMDLHRELSLVAPEMANRMIFLTGGAFTPKARSFLTDPPKEHIEKPFDAANLRAIVQRYLRLAV